MSQFQVLSIEPLEHIEGEDFKYTFALNRSLKGLNEGEVKAMLEQALSPLVDTAGTITTTEGEGGRWTCKGQVNGVDLSFTADTAQQAQGSMIGYLESHYMVTLKSQWAEPVPYEAPVKPPKAAKKK